MKYGLIAILLIANVFTTTSSFAGFMVETDKNNYQIGDTIEVAVSYTVDDQSAFTEITDFTFDYNWDETTASFAQFAFAAPFDTPTWVGDVYQAPNFGFLALDDFSVNPFAGQQIDEWALVSFEFIAIEAGTFDFDLSYIEVFDYNLDMVDVAENIKTLATIESSANVSEPPTLILFALLPLLALVRRKQK